MEDMGIILKPQRTRMSEYVTGLMEEGSYPIIRSSEKGVYFRGRKDDSQKGFLFLHSKKRPVKEVMHEINTARHNGVHVANVFYKDGENFHVRLAEGANFKADKSLKKYTHEDLQDMLHLRELEKKVLGLSSNKPVMAFYQPETARLNEGLRSYQMRDVTLDYSHIAPSDRRFDFVQNRVSEDYKIAKELEAKRKTIAFDPVQRHRKILEVLVPKDK